MDWLRNWDDLIHGTAVFSAAVPLCTALLLGALLARQLWIAVAGAMVVPLLWLFGLPPLPPASSDHALVTALGMASALVAMETFFNISWWRRPFLRWLAWTAVAWPLYPDWLSKSGELTRQAIVCVSIGASVAAWATLIEFHAHPEGGTWKRGLRITPAAFVPPTAALAVLLQLGGSMQFAQAAGALTSAVSAVCLVLLWKPRAAGLRPMAAFWGMMFLFLAWSGWLFMEIQVNAALFLLAAPLAAVGSNILPLPRGKRFFVMLWELILSGLVSGAIAWFTWKLHQGGADTMGY